MIQNNWKTVNKKEEKRGWPRGSKGPGPPFLLSAFFLKLVQNQKLKKPKIIETRETGNRGFEPDVETVWNRTEPEPSCFILTIGDGCHE